MVCTVARLKEREGERNEYRGSDDLHTGSLMTATSGKMDSRGGCGSYVMYSIIMELDCQFQEGGL